MKGVSEIFAKLASLFVSITKNKDKIKSSIVFSQIVEQVLWWSEECLYACSVYGERLKRLCAVEVPIKARTSKNYSEFAICTFKFVTVNVISFRNPFAWD